MEKLMNMVEKMFPGDEAAQAKAIRSCSSFAACRISLGAQQLKSAAAQMPPYAR